MRTQLYEVVALGGVAAALIVASVVVAATPPPQPAAAAPSSLVVAAPAPSPTAEASNPVERGRILFQSQGCIGCHSVQAAGLVSKAPIGPDLSGLPTTAATRRPGLSAEAYIRESVRQPQAYIVPNYNDVQMPTLPVAEVDLDALVAFLLAPRTGR